jgi:hypothetical protein
VRVAGDGDGADPAALRLRARESALERSRALISPTGARPRLRGRAEGTGEGFLSRSKWDRRRAELERWFNREDTLQCRHRADRRADIRTLEDEPRGPGGRPLEAQ